eukprot:4671902-Pyramimonas_sp.AAC.1
MLRLARASLRARGSALSCVTLPCALGFSFSDVLQLLGIYRGRAHMSRTSVPFSALSCCRIRPRKRGIVLCVGRQTSCTHPWEQKVRAHGGCSMICLGSPMYGVAWKSDEASGGTFFALWRSVSGCEGGARHLIDCVV